MGSYLVCNYRENNSKVISGLMADIIREVVGDYNTKTGDDWLLTEEDLAKLVNITDMLVWDEAMFKGFLQIGLDKNRYWANSWNKHPDLYGVRVLYQILSDFSVSLAHLVQSENKWVLVHWV